MQQSHRLGPSRHTPRLPLVQRLLIKYGHTPVVLTSYQHPRLLCFIQANEPVHTHSFSPTNPSPLAHTRSYCLHQLSCRLCCDTSGFVRHPVYQIAPISGLHRYPCFTVTLLLYVCHLKILALICPLFCLFVFLFLDALTTFSDIILTYTTLTVVDHMTTLTK